MRDFSSWSLMLNDNKKTCGPVFIQATGGNVHILWTMFGDEQVPRLRLFLAPPLAGGDEKFAKGARDDARIGSRGAPSLAWQVVNADFPVGIASTFQPVEQLGVD